MLRFHRWIFLLCLFQSVTFAAPNLRLEVGSEQPDGVFWDKDTLQSQTALLLWMRVFNDGESPRRVRLFWQIADSSGFVRVNKKSDCAVPGRSSILVRDLFKAPARGGYLLAAQIEGDARAQATWPFAVVTAPSEQFRPQSFFALDAPLLLSERELDFYQRAGARVLRSSVLDETVPRAAIDNQIRARMRHNLATLAVLDEPGNALNPMAWPGRALPALARYPAIKTWEVPGTAFAQSADFLNAARTSRPDAAFLLPFSNSLPATAGMAITLTPAGLETPGDASPQVAIPGGQAHPAALRRALLTARDLARQRGTALHVRAQLPTGAAPLRAAGDLVTRYAMAILCGASGTSAPLEAGGHARVAQVAAFAAMSKLLEDAAPANELFAHSPALCGALFKVPGGSVALLWATREGAIGRLKIALPGAQLLDVFGNSLARADNGNLVVPLGPSPVYVSCAAAPAIVAGALNKGAIEGMAPLAARALPITQNVANSAPCRLVVRLQNLLPQSLSGTLRLAPPPGWTLARGDQPFALAGGEIRSFPFEATSGTPSPDGFYAVRIGATAGGVNTAWNQALRVACADNVRSGARLKIDGELDDWPGAQWMDIRPARQSGAGARVALRWDNAYLYAAAQINEPRLRPARDAVEFWQGDALQLAFGTRGFGKPTAAPFRDTDYNFALLPSLGGQIVALNSSQPPLSKGARCVMRRDERRKITTYEACIPLAALPDLRPETRATGTSPVRFGWVLHNDEGAPLEWSAAVSVFQWWRNTQSFQPPTRLFLAAQMPLGFVQIGATSTQTPLITVPSIMPAPPAMIPPASSGGLLPTATLRRLPPPKFNPPLDGGFLPPLSPRLLPPVNPPLGRLLPPRLPVLTKTGQLPKS